jgi:hypothetical protein
MLAEGRGSRMDSEVGSDGWSKTHCNWWLKVKGETKLQFFWRKRGLLGD